MPKPRKQGVRGGRKQGRSGRRTTQIVKENFRCMVVLTLSAGAANIPIDPSAVGLNIPKLTTLSDPFLKYRYTRFKFRLLNNTQSHAADSIVAFVGKSATTTALTTTTQAFETGNYSFVSTTQSMHGNWCVVPKSVLRGMLPWYQTQGGDSTHDAEESHQGTLYGLGSGTSGLEIEIVGTLELDDQVDPTNSPLSEADFENRVKILEHRREIRRLQEAKAADEFIQKMSRLGFVRSQSPSPPFTVSIPTMSNAWISRATKQ